MCCFFNKNTIPIHKNNSSKMLTYRNLSLWLRDQSPWGKGPGIWILKSPQRLPLSPSRTGGQPLRAGGGSLDTTGLRAGGECQGRLRKNLALRYRRAPEESSECGTGSAESSYREQWGNDARPVRQGQRQDCFFQ